MFRPPTRITRGRVIPFPKREEESESNTPSLPTADNEEALFDERLMASARRGDLDAFNQLVQRHERAVYGVCMRLLRDQAAAEDAAQDTFIRAWNAMESFRGGLVRPWLLRIATNRAYDLLRAKSRRPADSLDAELFESEPEWTSQASGGDSPEEHAARVELSTHLEAALGVLPEDQRLAIILSDVQGYSYDEIAEIANVAVGTIKSRISRGRTRLRDELNKTAEQRELFARFLRSS